MVIASVKSEGAETLSEYVAIELQGDLESGKVGSQLSKCFIGELHFSKEATPILIIGHHILYGKLMELDKPLVIMKKSGPTELNNLEYHVKAIIRKKLIFKTRPKPIVTSCAKKPTN